MPAYRSRGVKCGTPREFFDLIKARNLGKDRFPRLETMRRGVAEGLYAEKMAGEGSPRISTLKKWPARGRRGFPR